MKKCIYLLILSLIILTGCNNMTKQKDIVQSEVYPKADKLCALTFDDGPDNEKTPLVLEKLKKYNVTATFFMVGELINEDTKDLVKNISDDGYEIANHSWNYESLGYMSKEQVKKYVDDTSAVIEEYSGQKAKFFRPPNMSMSPVMFEAIDLAFAGGVLAYDWRSQYTTAEQRADNVLKEMKDGAIILMHDVQPGPHPTPEALDIIIPELKRRGYEFVTLSELFERKNIELNAHEEKVWVYAEVE